MPHQSEYQTDDQRQRLWRTVGTGLGALGGGVLGAEIGHDHPILGAGAGAVGGGLAGHALGHTFGGNRERTLPRAGMVSGAVAGGLMGAAAPLAAGWLAGSMLGHGVGGAADLASEKVLGTEPGTDGREAAGVAGGVGGAAMMAPHMAWTAPVGTATGALLGAGTGKHLAAGIASQESERSRIVKALHTLPLPHAHALVTTLHRQGADPDLLSQARYEYNLRRQNMLQEGLKTSAFTDFSHHIGPAPAARWRHLGGYVGAGLGLGLGALAPAMLPMASHGLVDTAKTMWVDNAADASVISPDTAHTVHTYGEPPAKAVGGAAALTGLDKAFSSPWLLPAYMGASGAAGYGVGRAAGALVDRFSPASREYGEKFRSMNAVDGHLYAKALQRGPADPADVADIARAHDARRLGVQEQARSELLAQANARRMGLKLSAYLGGFDPLQHVETNPNLRGHSRMMPWSLGGALLGAGLGAGLMHFDPTLPDEIKQHIAPTPHSADTQAAIDSLQSAVDNPKIPEAQRVQFQADLDQAKAHKVPSFYHSPAWMASREALGATVAGGAGAAVGAGAAATKTLLEDARPERRGAAAIAASAPLAGANEITRASERGVDPRRLQGMRDAQGLRDASLHDFALAHHALAARGLRP